jgi:hypothetical protein
MGMRPSDSDIDKEIHEAKTYADAANRALALEAVTRWNKLMVRSASRHKPNWSPMVGVAIAAGFYFLDLYCPGCRQIKQVDLRKLDRHERTTLHGLIPMLSCRSRQPSPPFARLVKLRSMSGRARTSRSTCRSAASKVTPLAADRSRSSSAR